MARLPQPTTTSPGFLELIYDSNGITHKVRQRYISGVDPTDAVTIGPKALEWAEVLAPVMSTSSHITGYRSLNPSGIELFSGVFTPALAGTYAPDGAIASESWSYDLVGRGNPGGGLAQGNTRMMWFPGIAQTSLTGPSFVPPASSVWSDLLDFINGDDMIGADVYGTKAVFQNKVDLQFNAHYQKRYGL